MSEDGVVSKKLIIIGIVVFIFLGIVFLTTQSGANSGKATTNNDSTPTDTSASFMDAIIKRDGKTSYSMFSDKLKKTVSQDAWQGQLDLVFRDYGGGTPTFLSNQVVANDANGSALLEEVVYSLTFDKLGGVNNIRYDMTVTVIKKGDSWLVDEFSSEQR
jgi:hypothetical protein